jgi:hypothetical protein
MTNFALLFLAFNSLPEDCLPSGKTSAMKGGRLSGLRILFCEKRGLFLAEVRQHFFPKQAGLLKTVIPP